MTDQEIDRDSLIFGIALGIVFAFLLGVFVL